jgi:hypothetical protein
MRLRTRWKKREDRLRIRMRDQVSTEGQDKRRSFQMDAVT